MIRTTYRPGMVLGPKDVYVGRGSGRTHMNSGLVPGTWGWLGNPFDEKVYGLDRCIQMFAQAFVYKLEHDPAFKAAVDALDVDRVLCWCPINNPCHGDSIVAYLEER